MNIRIACRSFACEELSPLKVGFIPNNWFCFFQSNALTLISIQNYLPLDTTLPIICIERREELDLLLDGVVEVVVAEADDRVATHDANARSLRHLDGDLRHVVVLNEGGRTCSGCECYDNMHLFLEMFTLNK